MAPGAILIVEDSFVVALHLQATLQSEGYHVLGTCDSGEAALKQIEKSKPDLVLMDIVLKGGMDGIETATIIKGKYSLPVIYITALADKETIQRAKITEPYGYLTKPFEDREVVTVIEMALYKHRIESKLRESEAKYFSTVNSISDAVIVIDCDFRISYVNPSGELMLQCSQKEIQGKKISDVVSFRETSTGEFPVNPLQCQLGITRRNALPDNLILLGKHGAEISIGESSLSPLLDAMDKFTGLILVFKDLTERKHHERIVMELERQKLGALIEGQEKERSRIAKDLHDGLGQMLTAIKMKANAIAVGQSDAGQLYKLIDEAIQESVRISENLLPAKLKDFDLATCLRSLCHLAGRDSATKVVFVGDVSLNEIPQLQKINLYRITQEAINNAMKHANATTITVHLTYDLHQIRLCIEDDGRGIALPTDPDLYKKNGLVNIRDRVQILNGSLVIESDANRGTLIIVEVPLIKQPSYVEA